METNSNNVPTQPVKLVTSEQADPTSERSQALAKFRLANLALVEVIRSTEPNSYAVHRARDEVDRLRSQL